MNKFLPSFASASFALLILLSFVPVCVHAQSDRRDGNWWKDKTPSSKLDYIVGFFDGMNLGSDFSY